MHKLSSSCSTTMSRSAAGTALAALVPAPLRLARWRKLAARIIERSDMLRERSDQDLRRAAAELRWRSRTGIRLSSLLPEAFALVREGARRVLGMAHFPVQVMGGIALAQGYVAQMQTGEGKTLAATSPAFLRALPGRGCHVVTANDYLARRDEELMRPVFHLLGLTVGCVQSDSETNQRRSAYACDITYGTAKEFGFDFLRDRLRTGAVAGESEHHRPCGTAPSVGEPPVQRGHYFALVDEADSILIDEARTPLIIGLTDRNDAATVSLYRWARFAVERLEPGEDFVYDPRGRAAWLTERGCRRVVLMGKPSLLDGLGTERLYASTEQALTARFGFARDRDYVVAEDEVQIVDESTGRIMEGRKWQDGLHQAVEAKEFLPITAATGQAARVTVQSFFRRYEHLAGMTGTALPARREFKTSYGLSVIDIPTHRPCIRRGLQTRVFVSAEAKLAAIIEEVERLRTAGRGILIGTPSVAASESLSTALSTAAIPHSVLNARNDRDEAAIVARAGEPGRVTIATNMAGRGTDIHLAAEVRAAGGLHVLATEMHSAGRIDRQLIGRSARQGDPGSYQFLLSLDDELLRCLPATTLERLRRRARAGATGELSARWQHLFLRTQRLLERMHARQRRQLLRRERARLERYREMGLDPYVELTE